MLEIKTMIRYMLKCLDIYANSKRQLQNYEVIDEVYFSAHNQNEVRVNKASQIIIILNINKIESKMKIIKSISKFQLSNQVDFEGEERRFLEVENECLKQKEN